MKSINLLITNSKLSVVFLLLVSSIYLSSCRKNSPQDSPLDTTCTSVGVNNINSTASTFRENNSAILTGDKFFYIYNNVKIQKKIPITLQTSDSNIVLEEAFVARSLPSSQSGYWSIKATNLSNKTLCYIHINNAKLYDSNQTVIASNILGVDFLTGGVQKVAGVAKDLCLLSGESGYFLGVEIGSSFTNFTYDAFSKISIESIGYVSSNITEVNAKVIPKSYHAKKIGDLDEYSICVQAENKGLSDGYLGSYSTYMLLDSNLKPLIWGFLKFDSSFDGVIKAGETSPLEALKDQQFYFDGVSNKVLISLEYSDVKDTLSAKFNKSLKHLKNPPESGLQLNKAYLDFRNREMQNNMKELQKK